jgi:hypothetical protein
MKFVWLFLINFFCSLAGATSADDAARQKILSLAQPLAEDLVFYRWQSKTSGDSLLTEGNFSDKLYKYFMSMKTDPNYFVAGRGVYASENPHTSSKFVRGDDEGSLIEVHLKKGTKHLDLSDPQVLAKLQAQGISKEMVYQLDAPVAVKYDGEQKWWALKGQEGASFKPFDGSRLKPAYISNIYDKLATQKAQKIYRAAVQETILGHLDAQLQPPAGSNLAPLLDDAHLEKVIKSRYARVQSAKEAYALRDSINASPFAKRANDLPATSAILHGIDVRFTPIADVLAKYGKNNPDHARWLLQRKFATAKSADELLKLAESLKEGLSKYDAAFKGQIQPRVIFKSASLRLEGEQQRRFNSIADSYKVSDKAFLEAFNKKPTLETLGWLIPQAVSSDIDPDGALGKEYRKLLHSTDFKTLPHTDKISAGVQVREWALPHVRSAQDLVNLSKIELSNPSPDYKKAVSDFASRQADRFVALKPNMKQFAEYKNAFADVDKIIEFQKKMLPLVRTPEDFIALTDYGVSNPSDPYKKAMSEFIAKHADVFARTKPSMKQFMQLKRNGLKFVDDIMTARKAMLGLVKTSQDYLDLMEFGVDNPSDGYKTEMSSFAKQHMDVFLKTDPSVKDFNRLKKTTLNGIEDIIAAQRKMLPQLKKPADFIELMSFERDHPTDSYKSAMSQFAADHAADFAKLNPSMKVLNQLKSATLNNVAHIVTVQEKMLPLAKTPRDFLDLLAFGTDNPSDPFKSEQSAFAMKHFDRFLATNPSLEDYKQLKKNVLHSTIAQIIDSQAKMLPLVKTSEDFFKLVDYGTSGQSEAYLKAQREFTVEHMKTFLATKPSAKQIAALESQVNIREGWLAANEVRTIAYLNDLKNSQSVCSSLFQAVKSRLP